MKKIGIIRGGISPEYFISLKSGGAIISALQDSEFEVVDMLLDKDGVLHMKGIPTDLEKVSISVDYIWNALHGEFGEDGGIQKLLDTHSIIYSGSGLAASALAFNKKIAKDYAKNLGIKTPVSMLLTLEEGESVADITARIYKTMAPPWVVKPLAGGGSISTFFAFTPNELFDVVQEVSSSAKVFMVEQYIEGTEVAVGVLDNFRNKKNYILPVIDVDSPKRGILSHEKRFSEPYAKDISRLRTDEREKLGELAVMLHENLGAKDYSQSEFVVDRFGKIWFLEIDTHPALHSEAPFYKGLEQVGSNLTEFVKSVLERK
jgi:D-alanine-D-alanine ligase